MSESKTPRTDIEFNAIANKWPLSGNGDEWYNRCSETLNFARTLELELNEAREQRDASHKSNLKLIAGWNRLGDQFKGGNGPREFIRFNDACKKNEGKVVDTMLDCVFSLWDDLRKAESQLTTAQQEIAQLRKELSQWKP